MPKPNFPHLMDLVTRTIIPSATYADTAAALAATVAWPIHFLWGLIHDCSIQLDVTAGGTSTLDLVHQVSFDRSSPTVWYTSGVTFTQVSTGASTQVRNLTCGGRFVRAIATLGGSHVFSVKFNHPILGKG